MKAVTVLERASALCGLGRWDDAVALLGTVLATDPHNVAGQCLMAQALCGRADFDQAAKPHVDPPLVRSRQVSAWRC
jgi:predicted Zn-dependent protease